jgi:hypothetical protein
MNDRKEAAACQTVPRIDLIELAELRDRADRACDETWQLTKEFQCITALLRE